MRSDSLSSIVRKDIKLLLTILWLEGRGIRLAKYSTLLYLTVVSFQPPRLFVGVVSFIKVIKKGSLNMKNYILLLGVAGVALG
ncbi:MAG: hypothetical protein IJ689_05175, partial [Alphaproteobacteria bacterium]|nr:hypothetical protein [Alphaproteobacteria bacterium]